MSTIVLRSVKGSPLTNAEVDANFSNLNTDKIEIGGTYSSGTASGVLFLNSSKVLTSGSALTFDGTNLSATGTTTVNSANSTQVALVVKGETGNGIRQNFIGQTSSGQYNWQIGASITAAGNFAIIPSTAVDGATFSTAAYAITGTGTSIWSVAGSEQMRLTSTGLGIGTSSPFDKLEASKSTSGGLGAVIVATNPASSATGNASSFAFRANSNFLSSGFYSARIAAEETATANRFDMAFYTYTGGTASGTERMRLDSSGNLGLGVTPSAWSSQARAIQAGNYAGFYQNASGLVEVSFNSYQNTSNIDTYRVSSNHAAKYQIGGAHQWFTAPSGTAGDAISFTQAMTLDASGNLLVGTTSNAIGGFAETRIKIQTEANKNAIGIDGISQDFIGLLTKPSGAHTYFAAYFVNSSNTKVGSIDVSTTATTYTTSSDYRLKNTIAPMTGALAKVALLKPCTYKWNADGSDGEGFIAHELQAVVPQCVTGAKDAVDAKGNPQYQGIDTSFLVATLTAAIQELKAEFDAYKASHP